MEFTAREIANLLGGEVEGNPEVTVSKFSKIEHGDPSSLSFLSNPKYLPFIYSTKSSVVLVNKDFVAEQPVSATLVKVDDAYQALAQLLEIYNESKAGKQGIDPSAHVAEGVDVPGDIYLGAGVVIGSNVHLGANVKIHAGVVVGDDVNIGDDTVLFPGVLIYEGCVIGKSCTIHAGTVIGSDGFGFAPNRENEYKKVAQIGNVIIEDHVEIGANTTIDRATLGSTIIRKGVKLDNLIQVAHNVEIGENTVIAAQTGIAGSTKIGRDCMIGGQVGIIGHLTIADGVKIAAQSGIGSDITEKGAIVQGSPSFAVKDYKKSYVYFRKLPELADELERLKAEIETLRQTSDS